MVREKNADKRLEYNRQISDAERTYDELQSQKRSVIYNLESIETSLAKSFENLRMIDEELKSRSQENDNDFYDENQQKYRFVKQLINGQKEETEVQYRQALQKNEFEKERLQKERDNLSWE